MVSSQHFRERGIYDPEAVLKIIDDHVRVLEAGANEENHMMFLWQLLNVETWLNAVPEIASKQCFSRSPASFAN